MEFDYDDYHEALFDHNYLRWFHLRGHPILVEIAKVERRMEVTDRRGKKKRVPIVTFKLIRGDVDRMRPLVLNHTNNDTLVELFGGKPSKWVGKKVVLFESTTKLSGKTVQCIRIRAAKEKADTVSAAGDTPQSK